MLPAPATERRDKWRLFWLGLSVRLVGALLIWLGDGSSNPLRIGVVIVGLVLFVGGIAVLKFLLLAEPLSKLTRRPKAPIEDEP